VGLLMVWVAARSESPLANHTPDSAGSRRRIHDEVVSGYSQRGRERRCSRLRTRKVSYA
jgi:hypothetical protein